VPSLSPSSLSNPAIGGINSHPLYRLSYWGTELLIQKESNKITKFACFVNRFFPAQSANPSAMYRQGQGVNKKGHF